MGFQGGLEKLEQAFGFGSGMAIAAQVFDQFPLPQNMDLRDMDGPLRYLEFAFALH